MRFIDCINEAEKKPQVKELTIDAKNVISDAGKIYTDPRNLIAFLSRIERPSTKDARGRGFIYHVREKDSSGNITAEGKCFIKFNEEKSKQPTQEFKQIIDAIRKPKPTEWESRLKDSCQKLNNPDQQDFIETYFIPKIANPGVKPNDSKNYTIENLPRNYRLLGKAMVFYAGKCVSKLTDIDTEISADKFQEVLQGCFGAVPNSNGENEDFLSQFKSPKAKMMIDAAKCTINSISRNGGELSDENEAFYDSMAALLPMLMEAEKTNNAGLDFIELPKKISDFVTDDADKALIQAKNVASKYPKQYKIWFDKLEAEFQAGVKEEQDLERKSDNNEYVNPITGKTEKRHGKAWGTGGPNGFIRDNEYLDKLVKDIKGQKWTIFNCGAKMILGIFDALEHGGKIYQSLCDGLGEGYNQVKHSFDRTRPKDFDNLIKKYDKEDKKNDAYAASLCSIICGLTALYRLMGQGNLGTINGKFKTVTLREENNTTAIQNAVNDLAEAIVRNTKEEEEYKTWKEKKDKETQEKITKQENELKRLESEREGNKNSNESVAWKPQISVRGMLVEEEEKKKKSDIENNIGRIKKDLEKLKNNKDKAVEVNVDRYFALLDGYGQAVSYEPRIANIFSFLLKMFDEDRAKEQFSKMQGGSGNNENEAEEEEKSVNDSYRFITDKNLIAEADEFSTDDDQDEQDEQKPEQKKEKHDKKPEKETGKPGNLDWIQTGAGRKLVNLYKIFTENTGSIRPDLNMIRGLAKEKDQNRTLNGISDMFSKLNNSLGGIDIPPIRNGVVAFDYAFGKNADKSKFPFLASAFSLEGFDGDNENKDDDKTEEDKKNPGEFTREELQDKYNELVKLTESGSNIMNIVSSLDSRVKSVKDDSWIDTYKAMQEETEKELDKIWDKCLELYPDSKNTKAGHDWIMEKRKIADDQVFLNKIWITLSAAKYIGQLTNKRLKKVESTEFYADNILLEDGEASDIEQAKKDSPAPKNGKAAKHTIEFLLQQKANKLDKVDFTALLATDISDPNYDITRGKNYNEVEKKIAETYIGTRSSNDTNTMKSILKNIIGDPKKNKSEPYKFLEKNNCSGLANYIVYGPVSKNIQNNDRDIYMMYGAMVGVCNVLQKSHDKTDYRQSAHKRQESLEGYSENSLLNEIYKYIKGN